MSFIPQPDASGSHQQASGIILTEYLTTPLGRVGKVHSNSLVSTNFNRVEVGALRRSFQNLNVSLLYQF